MGLREMTRPTGPLPPSVYWLRRGAVALPVVALLVVIIVLASRGGSSAGHSGRAPATGLTTSSSPAGTPTTPPTTPPPTTPPTTPPPTSTATTPPPTSTPTTPSPASTTVGRCAPTSLAVSVRPSALSYATGSLVRFTTGLRTTGPACTAVGGLSVVVTSGHDRVWGSTDCVAAGSPTTRLADGASAIRSWNDVRTLPGCRQVVGSRTGLAGSYRVTVTWGGVTSAPVRFDLR